MRTHTRLNTQTHTLKHSNTHQDGSLIAWAGVVNAGERTAVTLWFHSVIYVPASQPLAAGRKCSLLRQHCVLAPNKNVITRPASPLLLFFFFFPRRLMLFGPRTNTSWGGRGVGSAATAGGKYGACLERGSHFTAVLFVSAGGGSCDEDGKE